MRQDEFSKGIVERVTVNAIAGRQYYVGGRAVPEAADMLGLLIAVERNAYMV